MTVAISQDVVENARFLRLIGGAGWTEDQPFRESTPAVEGSYWGKVRSGTCLILRKLRDGLYVPARAIFKGRVYDEVAIDSLERTGEIDEIIAAVAPAVTRWTGIEEYKGHLFKLARTPLSEGGRLEDALWKRIHSVEDQSTRMRLEYEFDGAQTARATGNLTRYLFGRDI